MANAHQTREVTGRGARDAGSGLVLAGDRSRHFKNARSHSIVVRLARVALPVGIVALCGTYVLTMMQTVGWGTQTAPPSIPAILAKEITMDNPRYEGFSKDGGAFVIEAKTAIPDLTNPSVVKLKTITGEVFDAKKSRTDLTAGRGLFDSKTNRLDLSDGINVVAQSGMTAQMQTATLMTKEGTLVSKTPVQVGMPTGTITANQMALNQKTRDVTFQDQVVARLTPPAKPDAAKLDAAAAVAKAGSPFGNSSAPIDITANRLDVNDNRKTAVFSGQVNANQGGARIVTEALEISYVGNAGQAAAAQPAADGSAAAPATKIQRIVAPGPVELTQATGDRVTGNSADFDAVGETAVITGNVVMTSGVDRRAAADRAEFRQKSDSFLLSGGVIVTQGRNELRGRRLFVDRKAGKTELSSPAEGTIPKSRIFARLYQAEPTPTKPGAPKKFPVAAAESAVPGGFGTTSFKTDPSQPLDVEADRLNVDDGKKEATFFGDVNAVQGDFKIRTSELKATYSGEAGLTSGLAAAQPGTAKAPAQLTRIDAKGKVIVTAKEGTQQVTGDWAIFDTKANTVTVGGDEVVLTQDKNIVTGNKLMIDMATGQSNMVREVAAGAAGATTAKPGRSSLVFYPQQDRPKGGLAPPKPATPGKPAASSWDVNTRASPAN